jgi:hypothetical protein
MRYNQLFWIGNEQAALWCKFTGMVGIESDPKNSRFTEVVIVCYGVLGSL